MMRQDAEKVVFAVKIIDLNAEILIKKKLWFLFLKLMIAIFIC